jgi:iron uptake system EfeUOB component EfeO/EfeM
MATSFGGSIAKHDMKVKKLLDQSEDETTYLIDQYSALKHVSSKNPDILKLLEDRNKQITKKLQVNEKQIEALLNVLEYLNSITLEQKSHSEKDIKDIHNKISILEKKVSKLRNVI